MRIDQFLHGYNNGHHLIAGSGTLPLKDADRMSYLSDWSGYVNPFTKGTSYITAYPLAESGSYVIAKSWYADEMGRPGCVWTHSFVVDLKSIGQKFDFCELMKLFRRPDRNGDDFLSYTKSVELKDENLYEERQPLYGIDPTRFLFMTALLLDRQKPAVYLVEKAEEVYSELCFRLIQNLPVGILKELSICSGSATARKFENGFYNLQFVIGKGETLMEPYPDNVGKPKADAGFKFWLDAVLSGRSDVAQMLHRFSEDIGNDTNKFLATLNLLKLLDDKIKGTEETALFTEIVNHLVNGFVEKESGALIKRSFLSQQVTRYFCDEKTYIVTLATINQWESLDYEAIDFHDRVQVFKKSHGIDEYVSLLVDLSKADYLNEEGKLLLSNALDGLSKEDAVALINKDWSLFKSIVTLNNKSLAGDFWIDLLPPQFLSLFAIFQKNVPEGFESWEKLYLKLLTIDTFVADNILYEFVKRIDEYVTIALDKWNAPQKVPINKIILNQCMKQHSRVIIWMGKQEAINSDIRTAVKRNITPDETSVVSMGSAPWKVFVKGEIETFNDANELVYDYVLAFNWHDNNALAYIKSVLPYIYEALSLEKLSYASWKKIEKYTGSVPFWRSWDNCRKVLIGVKDYCMDMNLQDVDMENFTSNKKLNGELMELWRKR